MKDYKTAAFFLTANNIVTFMKLTPGWRHTRSSTALLQVQAISKSQFQPLELLLVGLSGVIVTVIFSQNLKFCFYSVIGNRPWPSFSLRQPDAVYTLNYLPKICT